VEDNNRLSYFFLGMGLGVAIGILFAPKSGEETRELLRTKADEGKNYMKKRSVEVRDSASNVVERGKKVVSERVERGKEVVSERVERGKAVVAKQKDQLAAAVEAGKAAYQETVGSSSDETEGAEEGA